jgi:hypothetical protein
MSSDFLKDWLHRPELSQTLKLLIALSTFDRPVALRELLDRAEEAGFKRRNWSNPSASLGRATGLAINTTRGWEITRAGRQYLVNEGMIEASQGVINVAIELRKYLAEVKSQETAEFVGEAIRCYEMNLFRSSVVMSWLAAAYVLQRHVVVTRLDDFNDDGKRIDSRWKHAKTTDDLARLKESDFLNALARINVLGKNAKEALKQCLDLRNACGHPNSFKLGPNAVAAHVETLLRNVFEKFD